MKKFFAAFSLVLVLCFLLPAFSGCTGGEDPETPEAPKPASLKLAGMKTEFAFGEEFSSEGLKVTVVYSDKTEKPSTDFTVDSSKYKKDVSGSYSISVSCENLKKSYTVKVAAAPEKKIVSLKCSGMKTEFEYMEDFSSEGLIVTAVYEDETEGTLSADRYVVEPAEFNQEQAGQYDILVICGDIVGFYTVTVKEETHWWTSEMKLLMIGNSYSVDAIEHLYQIAKDRGVKATLGNLYIGGCSIDTHFHNAEGDLAAYDYYTNRNGVWKMAAGTRMRTAIEELDWDYISFQQNSANCGNPDTFGNLDGLMEYVRGLAPDAKFIWHMPWANASDSSDFAAYGGTQMGQWQAYVTAVQQVILPRSFTAIVTTGTAIQNARTSYIGPAGTALNRDGGHLSLGLGRYIAGLTLFMTVTGVSVEEIGWAPEGVSARDCAVAVESALNAVAHPFAVTQSQFKESL